MALVCVKSELQLMNGRRQIYVRLGDRVKLVSALFTQRLLCPAAVMLNRVVAVPRWLHMTGALQNAALDKALLLRPSPWDAGCIHFRMRYIADCQKQTTQGPPTNNVCVCVPFRSAQLFPLPWQLDSWTRSCQSARLIDSLLQLSDRKRPITTFPH